MTQRHDDRIISFNNSNYAGMYGGLLGILRVVCGKVHSMEGGLDTQDKQES